MVNGEPHSGFNLQVEPRFSLADLVDASGLTERTIRHYIEAGILPPASGRGRGRYYTTQHLELLTMIAQLREERLSIDEIRERLAPAPTALGPAAPVGPPGEGWRRIDLHDGLELHVREPLNGATRALLAEITSVVERWYGEPDPFDADDEPQDS